MDQATVRGLVAEHYAAAGRDEVRVAELYTDDAVLDFPQGRERIRGKARILAFRSAYPQAVAITIWRTVGLGDLWVNQGVIRYDGAPQNVVSIWEFRGDKVAHETIYVAESWDPPAWRAEWVEPMPAEPAGGAE